MSDLTGATAVPLVAPSPTDVAVTDPLLTYCLKYFQTVANTHGIPGWQAVQPNSVPVKNIFDHDPEEMGLSDKDLPALFMWRPSQDKRVDLASDIEVFYSKVTLLWVPQVQSVEKRIVRAPYANGIFKLIDIFLERARDPSWYVPGDTYTGFPATNPTDDADKVKFYGSLLPHWAGYRRMWLNRWRPFRLRIQMADGVKPRTYEAYQATFELEEQTVYDLERFPYAPNAGLDAKIITPSDGTNPAEIAAEQIVT